MKKSRGRGSKPGKGEDAAHGRPGPKAGGIVPTRDSGSAKHGERAGLLRMLEALKPHDHLCLIYESAEEWRAAAVPFIAIGLKRGDKCLYIVDTSTAAEIRKYLGEEGIDVASAEKSGRLSVLHQTEAYTREGSFDPDGVIALLIAETEKAVAEGYPALRVTGEMTWVLRGHPGSEKVLEYEAKLNSDLFPHYPCLAICQYDRWKFDPQVIKGVVMTHPLLIKGNHVYHNFYYIPPAEFLNKKRAEMEVQHWLNNLQRQQRARESLWESEERYRTLFERTANPVLVIDADGNYVDGNKAALQFLECTPEELRAKNVRDAIPPRQESVMDEHTPLWKTGGAIETEYYVGGNMKTLYLTITPGTWWGKEVTFGIGVGTDVTERKRAEDELRESNVRFDQLARQSRTFAWEVDAEGLYTYFSHIAEGVIGYRPDEIVGRMHFYDLHPEEGREEFKEAAFEVFKRKEPFENLENLIQTRDGRIVWVSTNGIPIMDADGTLRGYRGSDIDITERKRAEEELIKNERFLQTTFDSVQDGISVLDTDLNILNVNKAHKKLYPHMLPLQGKKCYEVYQGRSEPCEVCPSLRSLKTGKLERDEVPFIKEGEVVGVLELYAFPVLDETGEATGVVEYVRDITERQRAEEELRKSEERYRQLTENAGEAILVVQDGVVKFANPKGAELSGYTAEELASRPFADFIHPDDSHMVADRYLKRLRGEQVPETYDFRIKRKDGTIRWGELNAVPITWEDRPAVLCLMSDITERKEAEDSLRRSERNFRDSLEESPLGVRIVTEEGKTLYVNKALMDMCGYGSREELIAVPRKQLHTPESYAEHKKRVRMRKRGERVPVDYEISIVRKDGHVRHLWVSRKEVLWNDERRFQMVYQDITERKRAEEELKAQTAYFQQVFDSSPYAVVMVDTDDRVTRVNGAFESLFGYSSEEVPGRSLNDLVIPEHLLEEASALYETTLRGDVVRKETIRRRKDGSLVEVSVVGYPIRIEGELLGVYVMYADITERKQAEQALWESEERYRALFDRSSDLIYVYDFEGNLLDANDAVLRLTGYDREDIPGLNLASLLDNDQLREAFDRMQELRDTGVQNQPKEYRVKRKDGSFVEIETMGSLVYREGKPYAVQGVARDLTERRMMQAQLILTDRLASIGQLASGIAHELNNPLTSVIGFSDLLLAKEVPEETREYLSIINSEAKRTSELVSGLLAFARKQGTEKTSTDINSIIQTVLNLRAYEHRVSNVEVDARLAPELPAVTGNASQLQQVFTNIIVNAEQSVLDSHGRGKLTVVTERVGDVVRASIADDGPGISPDIMDRIFSPFLTTKEVGKGTGLGLSICHGIVTEHGGSIYVRSKPGQGATFVVELPVSKQENDCAEA